MITTFFLFGIGDFIENNPAAVVIVIAHAVIVIMWLARLEITSRSTRLDMDEYIDKHNTHVQNAEAHVNQLYIGTLKERIEKLETTVERGHKAIEDKIDQKFENLAGRINNTLKPIDCPVK